MGSKMVFIPDIHIGELITEYLQNNGTTKAELARYIEMNPANLGKLLKRKSMETDILIEICKGVCYNFFAHWGQDPQKEQGISISYERPDSIGKIIENRLAELKLTQRYLAVQLGVSQPEVNRILKKTSFDTDKLAKLSRILNYNFFHEFYYRENIPTTKEEEDLYWYAKIGKLTTENDQLKEELEKVRQENIMLKEQLKRNKK